MHYSDPIFHLKLALYGRDIPHHVLRQQVAQHDKDPDRLARMDKTGQGEAPLLVKAFESWSVLDLCHQVDDLSRLH